MKSWKIMFAVLLLLITINVVIATDFKQDLELYFSFDNKPFIDDLNNRNITEHGTILLSDDAKNGNSISFDNASAYYLETVDTADDFNLYASNITMAGWVKTKPYLTSSILMGYGNFNSWDVFLFGRSNDTNWYFVDYGENLMYNKCDTNNWTFIAVTYSDLTVCTYCNNVSVTCQNLSQKIIFGDTTIKFGGFGNPDEYFNGNIDELGIWSYGMSPSQINELYNLENSGSFPVVLFPKINCSGTKFCDNFNASESTYLWQYNNWECSQNTTELYINNETARIQRKDTTDTSCMHSLEYKSIPDSGLIPYSLNPKIEVTLIKTDGYSFMVVLCNESRNSEGEMCYNAGTDGEQATKNFVFAWHTPSSGISYADECIGLINSSSLAYYDGANLTIQLKEFNATYYYYNLSIDDNYHDDGTAPYCNNIKSIAVISLASWGGTEYYDNVRVWYDELPACIEDWLANYYNISCNGTFINEIKYYIDNNYCNTTTNLPIDNGTISNTYPCTIPSPEDLMDDNDTSNIVSFGVTILILFLIVIAIIPKDWLKGIGEETITTLIVIILIIIGFMVTLNLFFHFIG